MAQHGASADLTYPRPLKLTIRSKRYATIQAHRQNSVSNLSVREPWGIFQRGLLSQGLRGSVQQRWTDLLSWFRDSPHWITHRKLPQCMGEKLDCSDYVSRLARSAERHPLDRLPAICLWFIRADVNRLGFKDLPIHCLLPRIIVRLLRFFGGPTA